MFCYEGMCTHWCNNSTETPGGGSDHACPSDYLCWEFKDTDSAGRCEPNSGGTGQTGSNCDSGNDCRSYWCDSGLGKCIDVCSHIDDCRNTGPGTNNWTCQVVELIGGGKPYDLGICQPAPGGGRTGQNCSGWSDCRDGYCPGGKCVDLCCTEAECPSPYVCWFYVVKAPSAFKACMDKGATGTDGFGTLCSGSNFFDSNCRTGLCADVGEGERCNSFCCRDSDCPNGYHCELALAVSSKTTVRACYPD